MTQNFRQFFQISIFSQVCRGKTLGHIAKPSIKEARELLIEMETRSSFFIADLKENKL